ELLKEWKETIDLIRSQNSSIKIIFTVSPVRHIKDGLIENNRSKAKLIELAHELTTFSNVHYFPSYEILIDELRDYRFYEDDLIHPNKLAIQYIWERFIENTLSDETQLILKERNQVMSQLNHKSLHPNSDAEIKRMKSVEISLNEFRSKFPDVLIPKF